MNISENLKRLRVARKLSQAEMAKLLGFKSHNAYSHWEIGKTSPNVRDLDKIAEVLGVTVYQLLFLGAEMPQEEVQYKKEDVEKDLEYIKRENALLRALIESKGVTLPKFDASKLLPFDNLLGVAFSPMLGRPI